MFNASFNGCVGGKGLAAVGGKVGGDVVCVGGEGRAGQGRGVV